MTFVALLVLTLAAITWAVLSATQNAGQSFANSELDIAERVVNRLLADNQSQLISQVTVLAEDYGFRQAMATGDEATQITALANHGERIGADVVLYTDAEGNTLLSSHDLTMAQRPIAQRIGVGPAAFGVMVVSEGRAFQMAMVPVRAPNVIGWVGLGFPLNQTLLAGMKAIAKADISVLVNGQPAATLTTLPTPDWQAVVSAQSVAGEEFAQFSQQDWINRAVSVDDNAVGNVTLVLSVSASALKAQFYQLQQRMVLIGVVALVMVVLVIVSIANGISKPLQLLARAADRMTAGDYDSEIVMARTDELGVLANTLNGMQAAIKQREARITYVAEHDEPTGLPNRDKARQILDGLFADGTIFTAALLRVVNIKRLNDLYGMLFIQRFVPLIAERMKRELTACGSLARIGSDEFLLVLNAGALLNEKEAESLVNSFSHPFTLDGVHIVFDVCVGLVECPVQAANFEELIRRSTIALAEAVHLGVPVRHYQAGADEIHLRKLNVTARLQCALAAGNFEIHYQPQLNLATQKVEGVEALMRWQDDEIGRVFPDEFIPLAEESGLITGMTRWVLEQVRTDCASFAALAQPLEISINLSAKDILDDEAVEELVSGATEGLPTGCSLAYEITETALVADAEKARENLLKLQRAGISLSMDDFGTGFSSLSQLKLLPVSKLKIDKSFVMQLSADQEDQKIVRATINMAKALNLKTVAEGVEDARAQALLGQWGCTSIQGYYLAKPMPLPALLAWLTDNSFNHCQQGA